MAEGQVIDRGKRVVEGLIIARGPFARRRVEQVDGLLIPVCGFQRATGVVDRLGPGERIEERQAVRVALLDLDLRRFIGREAGVVVGVDVLEGLIGPAGVHSEALTGLVW